MRYRITLLAAIALLIPTTARALTKPPFAGNDAYSTLLIIAHGIPEPYLLTGALALALAALLLFTRYTQQHDIPEEALLVIALSPAFLTAPITDPQALLLGAGSMILLATNTSRVGPLIAAALGLIGPAAAIPLFIYVAAQIVRKHQLRAITATVLGTAALLATPATLELSARFAELQYLGASSILIGLLAVTGALLLWDENTYPWLLAALSAVAAAAFLPQLRLVGAFAAAVPAGFALRTLRKRSWALETIKSSSLMFVLLGLFFTAVSAGALAVRAPPTDDLLETAQITVELAKNDPVFTISEHADALQWYGVNTTRQNAATILSLRDADEMQQYTTEFILLEADANAPNLRFVLENSNNYVLLTSGAHELWREVPDPQV